MRVPKKTLRQSRLISRLDKKFLRNSHPGYGILLATLRK
jgi:hypothetical protein